MAMVQLIISDGAKAITLIALDTGYMTRNADSSDSAMTVSDDMSPN